MANSWITDPAPSMIQAQPGKHPERVFTYQGQPVTKTYSSAWKRAREDAAITPALVLLRGGGAAGRAA